MPEPARSAVTLARLIADHVRELPGVIRLEPDVRALRALGARPDGVLVREHDGVCDVRLEIATDSAAPARRTAELVEAAVMRLLLDQGRRPGSVRVSVLAVEHH